MNLEPRVTALESRVTDIEINYSEIMYQTHREVIRTQITLTRLAAKSGVAIASDADVDAELESRP
ncbi:hypothetical protein [Nocardia amamiensis]|uniref:hypothetical protein n=1 Tax=Nocardia amamiensis TaxID=404578 RepID=UPI000829C968|nr:hypothetical protein [Nocardia amamiensis]